MDEDLSNTDSRGSVTTNTTERAAAVEGECPRVLCDVHGLLAETGSPLAGVVWKLTEVGRQLDANLVRLSPDQMVGEHTERDLDVLIIGVAGTGRLLTNRGPLSVEAGTMVWLPRGSTRSLVAGATGLSYLTVHQRRPGMWIGVRS